MVQESGGGSCGRLKEGDVKHRVNLQGGWEAEVEGTGIDYFFFYWEGSNVSGSEFFRFNLEGEVSRGQPYLLAHLVVGCGNLVSVSKASAVLPNAALVSRHTCWTRRNWAWTESTAMFDS